LQELGIIERKRVVRSVWLVIVQVTSVAEGKGLRPTLRAQTTSKVTDFRFVRISLTSQNTSFSPNFPRASSIHHRNHCAWSM